jgi:transposase, IS5 family
MKQTTPTGFEKFGKRTRRAQFLADMDKIIPWTTLRRRCRRPTRRCARTAVDPPIPLERMLRIYFLQLWFNLSDPAVEEALYDSVAMRAFVGIVLGTEGASDETTVCKFRHLLERNKLGKVLLTAVNERLRCGGIKIAKGTIVDPTIICTPSSTKNESGKRDPEMHQTAKGQQWFFGLKAHVGVNRGTKLIHTVLVSAANVHDREALAHLLNGKETRVWGDQGYQGQTAVIHARAPKAKDFTNKRYRNNGRINEIVRRQRTVTNRGYAPRSSMCSA